MIVLKQQGTVSWTPKSQPRSAISSPKSPQSFASGSSVQICHQMTRCSITQRSICTWQPNSANSWDDAKSYICNDWLQANNSEWLSYNFVYEPINTILSNLIFYLMQKDLEMVAVTANKVAMELAKMEYDQNIRSIEEEEKLTYCTFWFWLRE